VPVLYEETLAHLAPVAGGVYLDCTVGGGGHAAGILQRSSPDGRLLGIDADESALREADEHLRPYSPRYTLVHASFGSLEREARWLDFAPVDGILFDLGVSSFELDRPERGFSFRVDSPLDMRFDQSKGQTAAELVNSLPEGELADLLFRYGEEPRSRAIARAVVSERGRAAIRTTEQLAKLVERVVRTPGRRIHPATRTFQALRIAVNRELETLEEALPQAVEILKPGGRLVVIAFHSLEDRVVKRFFAEGARGCICPPELPVCVCGHVPTLEILTKKAVQPTEDEVRLNPRSRSAKLRAARKL
jgi:16S rRNA (cytosine1402-N4)-methyltransferase